MKKILTILFVILLNHTAFSETNEKFTEPVVIEITDETLDEINYYEETFNEPTTLRFTNLTTVNGKINFYKTTNLVGVEFPLLTSTKQLADEFDEIFYYESKVSFYENLDLVNVNMPALKNVDGTFYFYGNSNLEVMNAPNLEYVYDEVLIYGHTNLEALTICNLSEVLSSDDMMMEMDIEKYNIGNNNAIVDATPFCFSQSVPQDIILDNTTILENQPKNTLVGILTPNEGFSNEELTYYFPEFYDNGNDDLEFDEDGMPLDDYIGPFDYDNDKFEIVDNELRTNAIFDFETKSEFTISIGVKNSLGEKFERELKITILDEETEGIKTIEVTETTLEKINTSDGFTEPTILIYTNLTTITGEDPDFGITGNLSFYEVTNLIEVHFPVLTEVKGSFSFYGNPNLTIIDAPNLTSVTEQLSVYGNTELQELNICNLSEIKSTEFSAGIASEFSISNNNAAFDAKPLCFIKGAPKSISLNNNTIDENQELGTLVGTLSAETDEPNENLTYYLNDFFDPELTEFDEEGNETIGENEVNGNNKFKIVNNELRSDSPLDFESVSEYTLSIGVRNKLGEKYETELKVNVTDVAVEEIQTITIEDTSLESLSYYNDALFVSPTKLVFPNLTNISEGISLTDNVNLVSIELPLLETTGYSVYINSNPSLTSVLAPKLSTIHDYLYVAENQLLQTLDVCLTEILPFNYDLPLNNNTLEGEEEIIEDELIEPDSSLLINEPFYYIRNNPILNEDSTCLVSTNAIYEQNEAIDLENDPLVGTFSTENDDTNVEYFFTDNNGAKILETEDFIISGNELKLARSYEEYTDTDFNLNIKALVTRPTTGNVLAKRATSIKEQIELNFALSIANSNSLSVDKIETKTTNFTIYPNPSSSIFYINTTVKYNVATITDLTGKLVKTFKLSNNGFDISDIASGVYLLSIKDNSNNSLSTKKLVID